MTEEKAPDPFFKKLRLSVDQQSGILYSLLLMYAQVENYQNILTLRCLPLAFFTKTFLPKFTYLLEG